MRITVYGRPITQGSKTRTRWGMRDDNGDTLKPWRDNVRSAALDVLEEGGTPFAGDPVIVCIIFTFVRPNSHFGAGKNSKIVKSSAPLFPSNRGSGDVDKLIRACLDSLADAGVFANDCQVVSVHAAKVWVGDRFALDRPGAVIDVVEAFTAEPVHESATHSREPL